MTSITRVIKDLIDANTIAEIQKDVANGTATIGITNVIYTDENYANTANDYIANTSTHGHIKVLGYGFLPNANVVLSLVSDRTNTEILLDYSNTYYVNFKELRAEIENSQELSDELVFLKNNPISFSSNNFFSLFVINENGTNNKKDLSIKIERRPIGYGWFGGGTGPVSTIDRITFASDVDTASVRGPLSLARRKLAARGNDNYGWFGGGSSPSVVFSRVDRIDFSADTATATIKGTLSLARHNLAATGNDNYGWFGGGSAPSTTSLVDRIDFADDTNTALVRGPLSLARYDLAALDNNNYGWYGGGFAISLFSRVDRIDFADDTSTASVRGSLSSTRQNLAATGNDNYGWFGGGFSPSGTPGTSFSTVNRIEFAADTNTALVRGPLSLAKWELTATSDNNYGWFGGGNILPGPVVISTVDRINFADDTITAVVRGKLSQDRSSLASTSGNL
jgi:hypothetical protein